MSVTYFDICDKAFKRDSSSGAVTILRVSSDGKVFEDKPTKYESSMISRNWLDSSVISE